MQAGIQKAMTDPELVKRYAEMGFEAQNISADEFKAFLASENARYAKLIRDNRIRSE
jgi:tripartite-type tricarboxylate transporter receptor subunit TctC